jgi:hypothetical protein
LPETVAGGWGGFMKPSRRLLFRRKIRFTRPANRASPTIREFLEGCACGDAIFWISYGGIINIPTNIAGILFHVYFSFRLDMYCQKLTTFIPFQIRWWPRVSNSLLKKDMGFLSSSRKKLIRWPYFFGVSGGLEEKKMSA